MNNVALLTDSYKLSHWNQYPKDMIAMQSYMEARVGSQFERVVFFGLQYYLMKYLLQVPTLKEIEEAAELAKAHGEPFNTEGWKRIHRLGHFPVKIHAVPEGTAHSPGTVLMTIESTDPDTCWIVNYLETLLMKLWYPCTVASKSRAIKEMINGYYGVANLDANPFVYHNFGDRGSTSVEAAAIGAAAHLSQFMGTDNFASLKLIQDYYGENGVVGFSIPATEHSTVTSWGQANEHRMIESYLDSYKGSSMPMIACVLDSYDLFSAVSFCCSLRKKIESNDYPILVMRPDSGNPLEIIPKMLEIMNTSNLNYKDVNGYKLFDKYRIIWGDGITPATISSILSLAMSLGYSPANFAFGSGGDLMQNVNRDTCKFAIKCCAVKLGDSWRSVRKEPKTDMSKASKFGFQYMPSGFLRFNNGIVVDPITFADVRKNSL